MARQPYMPLFTADWRGEPLLRLVSPAAELVWFRMCLEMWDSPERGVLLGPSGKPLPVCDLAALIGRSVEMVEGAVAELEARSIFSRREDGAVFSRRMVREAERSEKNKKNAHIRWAHSSAQSESHPVRNATGNATGNAKGDAPSGYGSGSGSDLPKEEAQREENLAPLLQASIDQAKAKKAEQLTLANPEPPARPLDAFVEAWNKGCLGTAIPKAIAPGTRASARDKMLAAEVLRFPEPESWFWCVKALGASNGHNGRGPSGWTADLPWLLARGNGAKLEQWMARGAELRAKGGKVPPPPPVPGERGDERTVRAANAYREEQQKKHEATMAGSAPTDPETMKRGLALVRSMLPQFRQPGGDQ